MIRYLDKFGLLLGLISLGLTQWLGGLYGGVSYGASKICDYQYPTIEVAGVSYWMSHADPYFYLVNLAAQTSLGLLVFSVLKLLENKSFIRVLVVVPVGLCLLWWFQMYRIIQLDIGKPDKYIDLLRETSQQHWALLILILAVFFLQLASIAVHFYSAREVKPT